MSIAFKDASQKFSEVLEFLSKELGAIRAGRASTSLVENIKVEVYGQKMAMNQIANISVVDPTLLTVRPWDKNNIEPVRQAIADSDSGLNPMIDGEVIKLPVPSLTEERRLEFVKLMKNKLEEARITVRQLRKEIIDTMEAQKEKKEITEDDLERNEKELQKLVDEINEKIEALGSEKEKELMRV